MDKYGSGVFLASRDGGKRSHLGRDYIIVSGDDSLFPIHGVIEKVGRAYPDSSLGSVTIRGAGEHRGLLVKILYTSCDHPVGYEGQMGDVLGMAQSVSVKYPGITEHLHVELWVCTDPESLMAASHPEFGGPHV
jgi:hypothetical protein